MLGGSESMGMFWMWVKRSSVQITAPVALESRVEAEVVVEVVMVEAAVVVMEEEDAPE